MSQEDSSNRPSRPRPPDPSSELSSMSSAVQAMIEEAARDLPGQSGSQYCCVVGCHNNRRRDGPRGIKFHSFPRDKDRRLIWIKAVKRANPSKPSELWQPKAFDVVCSDHFAEGKKSNSKDSPSYNPTVFPTHDIKVPSDARIRRRQHLELARSRDHQKQLELSTKRGLQESLSADVSTA